MKVLLTLGFLIFITSGCSTTPNSGDAWPNGIPPRSYFIEYFQQDKANQEITTVDNYLLWIRRFYQGWELYNRGWLQATDELLATLDNPADIPRAQELSYQLGKIVSAEWAKDARFRVINTKHLSIWGNTLTKSMVEDDQIFMLKKIIMDANHLLLYKIQPNEIAFNRYYEPERFVVDDANLEF